MALAVASTSSAGTNNASSVTVTKPTGVAVGDVLLIVASKYNTPAITCSGFTEAISVSRGTNTSTGLYLTLLWRIADASDVSASNYSVSMAANDDGGNVAMFRVTGWPGGTLGFINDSATNLYTNAGTPATLGMSGISVGRPNSGIAIMAHCMNTTDTSPGFSFATYSVTSTDSNPSWTEVRDNTVTVDTSVSLKANHLAVAYATFTDTSEITAYSAALTESTTDDFGWGSFLVVITEPTSPSTDVSHITLTPSISSVTVSNIDANSDISHIDLSLSVQSITTPRPTTTWTAGNKQTTNWTKQDKT